MAMTFTLVSHLREQLSRLVRVRAEKRQKEEMEKERIALEVIFFYENSPQVSPLDIILPTGRGSSNSRDACDN